MKRASPSTGALVAGGGGLILFGSLFLTWYRFPGGASGTAWQTLSAADVLLAALVGLVVLLAALGPVRTSRSFVRYTVALAMALGGLAALAVVVARVLFPPGAPEVLGVLGVQIEASQEWGAFVGLAGALGMAVGGAIVAVSVALEGASSALERVEQGL